MRSSVSPELKKLGISTFSTFILSFSVKLRSNTWPRADEYEHQSDSERRIKCDHYWLGRSRYPAVILLGGVVQNAELSAPPDVATSHWLPLGESFGLVIVRAAKTTRPKAAQPGLSGYFMAKGGDIWFRLIEEWPGKVVPLAQN
jgi:hypothetical protein